MNLIWVEHIFFYLNACLVLRSTKLWKGILASSTDVKILGVKGSVIASSQENKGQNHCNADETPAVAHNLLFQYAPYVDKRDITVSAANFDHFNGSEDGGANKILSYRRPTETIRAIKKIKNV